MSKCKVIKDDCLSFLESYDDNSVDLIYLDPPFFTKKIQKLKTRDRKKEFSYDDLWGCHKDYAKFLFDRITQMKRVLSNTGNIFVHCDKNAAHIIRAILDDIFGQEHFRSEIIWHYKRWSNAKKGLLPAHQTIYFYSKTDNFKFNTIYNGYSEATNIDQILQKRARDVHGKAIYARDTKGNVLLDDEKKGVPLSDVWDIPYLNPKAKERVGYPTQKPVLLLERIIKIASDSGDLVLDPFCGSGTTLVAAKLLKRNAIGVDVSKDAIDLSKDRLKHPMKSDSPLLTNGRHSYLTADNDALAMLKGLDYLPVQRNAGIDVILKQQYNNAYVLVRVQRANESLLEASTLLAEAAKTKKAKKAILVKTHAHELFGDVDIPKGIQIIEATSYAIQKLFNGHS